MSRKWDIMCILSDLFKLTLTKTEQRKGHWINRIGSQLKLCSWQFPGGTGRCHGDTIQWFLVVTGWQQQRSGMHFEHCLSQEKTKMFEETMFLSDLQPSGLWSQHCFSLFDNWNIPPKYAALDGLSPQLLFSNTVSQFLVFLLQRRKQSNDLPVRYGSVS